LWVADLDAFSLSSSSSSSLVPKLLSPVDRVDYACLLRQAIQDADEDWLKSLLIVMDKKLIDQEDADGLTPLMHAVATGYGEGVELLLQHGARVNHMNSKGFSPLFYLLSLGSDKKPLKMAIPVDPESLMPINIPFDQEEPFQQSESWSHIIHLLIEKGVDFNQQDFQGQTVIMHAIDQGNLPMVRLLIDKGACLKIKDHNRNTAFDHAQDAQDEAIVAFLKDRN